LSIDRRSVSVPDRNSLSYFAAETRGKSEPLAFASLYGLALAPVSIGGLPQRSFAAMVQSPLRQALLTAKQGARLNVFVECAAGHRISEAWLTLKFSGRLFPYLEMFIVGVAEVAKTSRLCGSSWQNVQTPATHEFCAAQSNLVG